MDKDKKPSGTSKVKDRLAPLVARAKGKALKNKKTTTSRSQKPLSDFDWYSHAKKRLSIADKRERSDPFSSERFKLITDDVLYGNDNSSEEGEFDEY